MVLSPKYWKARSGLGRLASRGRHWLSPSPGCENTALTGLSLVEKPFKITLQQIVEQFEQITLPITLVCAGNRRKEQNTVRKSKGFSWGPAGLSTALFTGTLLANVLRSAKPLRGAKYLCMEGADKLVRGGKSQRFHIFPRNSIAD